MEESSKDVTPSPGTKTGIEGLSKAELISKYKGVLNLAKKAKLAKDELAEENRELKESLLRTETQKEADKKALMTMKETLEEFTEQKLQMSTELEKLQLKSRKDEEALAQLQIENESLRRQMDSLTTDNETLLNDIDAMETRLKKVNTIGVEQRKHLELLELEVNRLKERDCHSASLEQRISVMLEENKDLKTKEQNALKNLKEITEKYNNVKEINAEQRKKFNSLKDRFVDVYKKVKKLNECKRVLLETQHEYADAVTKWQNEIIRASKKLCEQMRTLQLENDALHQQVKDRGTETPPPPQSNETGININTERLSEKLRELSKLANEAIEERNNQKCLVETLSAEIDTQKLENRRLSQELSDLKVVKLETNDKIRESGDVPAAVAESTKQSTSHLEFEQLERQYSELERELKAQKLISDKLRNELEENSGLNSELESMRSTYEDLVSRFELKKREHADLLGEMRELNEALKARGDVISRQEEKQQELIAELKRSLARQQLLETLLSDKEESIVTKSEELQKVNNEMNELKLRIQELDSINARSDEHIAAITEELQSLKQSAGGGGGGSGSCFIDTQSDTLSIASNMSKADELNRLREVDDGVEERYNKLRALAVKLKKKLQDQTALTNDLTQQLKSKETIQNELHECKSKIKQLEEQEKLNESLQAEIKKLKSSRKQANVLSLEIEAAERSLSDVSAKLNAKTTELNELNTVLETKESTIVQLRKEIALLEASNSAECKHSQELKLQIDRLQSQIKEAIYQKQLTMEKNKDLEFAHERLQLEIEDLRLQLAQSASKQELKLSELSSENTKLNTKLKEMEITLANAQSTLRTTTQSLENMRIEYMEYKVKAQAVLRKNQSKDTSRERELEEEMTIMRTKLEEVEKRSQMQSAQLEESAKQIDILREDNECLSRRNDELYKLVEELRLNNDVLMQEQSTLLKTQQDALKQQREQLDSIEIYHKEQLQSIERNYQSVIEQLKHEALVSKSIRRPPPIIGAVAKIPPQNTLDHHHNKTTATGELLLMEEREDAEGSEEANASLSALAAKRKISSDSSSRRSVHEFMPLDELLNAPLNALNSETVLNAASMEEDNINANLSLSSSSVAAEHLELLSAAKERIQMQESRLRHLTALLAENEQDLAKLTQMNDMLKEELRRQERAVERDHHMQNLHNSEYLKNVFIKFLTLNSVDEKTRLIPVLNTILKLSRSEMEMLNCVAKGQKVSEQSSRSWSNFLPSWGGGGNSGN